MCKHFIYISFHLRVHESDPAMEDQAIVICCTVGRVDIDQANHFVTKSTCTFVSADRQIPKEVTLLFYVMLARKRLINVIFTFQTFQAFSSYAISSLCRQ
jgi:hypothetical protein